MFFWGIRKDIRDNRVELLKTNLRLLGKKSLLEAEILALEQKKESELREQAWSTKNHDIMQEAISIEIVLDRKFWQAKNYFEQQNTLQEQKWYHSETEEIFYISKEKKPFLESIQSEPSLKPLNDEVNTLIQQVEKLEAINKAYCDSWYFILTQCFEGLLLGLIFLALVASFTMLIISMDLMLTPLLGGILAGVGTLIILSLCFKAIEHFEEKMFEFMDVIELASDDPIFTDVKSEMKQAEEDFNKIKTEFHATQENRRQERESAKDMAESLAYS